MIPFLGPIICIAFDVTSLEHWNLVLRQRKVMLLIPGISLNTIVGMLRLNTLKWRRQLVTSVPPQNLGFISRAVSVGYDVDKVAMVQVSFCVFKFFLVTLISSAFHTYSVRFFHLPLTLYNFNNCQHREIRHFCLSVCLPLSHSLPVSLSLSPPLSLSG